jgi:hypothetical protein
MITIPLNIFLYWHTKSLPYFMQQNIEYLKLQHPCFSFHLYDEKSAAKFIQNHFDNDVLFAFNNLIPHAYKSDLWRYCILYKYGGIYLDVKYKTSNDFRLKSLTNKEYFVKDRDCYFESNGGTYQGLMVCLAGNSLLLKCIHQIVWNVKTKNYDFYNALYPTGPGLIGAFTSKKEKESYELTFLGDEGISYQNKLILYPYPEYYTHDRDEPTSYGHNFNAKNIYL